MKIRVLTWNISYAYGLGSEGDASYEFKPQLHFESTLDSMAQFIRNTEIDVVLLQEVDFNSKRSHHLNQLEWLARKTGLLYRSEIVSWKSFYVPYPGLKPSRQFGSMVSGGGILSRFPIRPILQEMLPKPRENSALYNFFYLHRYLQIASIHPVPAHPELKFNLMNLHLEAFSQDNRELHLIKAQNRLIDYDLDFAGGDFNGVVSIPGTLTDRYVARPAPEPTFPSTQADRILDGFILKKKDLQEVSIKTLESGSLSDHFPVLLEFTLPV